MVREVADAEKTGLIDHSALWSGYSVLHPMWMSNAYHPSAFGHVVLARGVFAALDIEDSKSGVCNLFHPGKNG